MNLRQSTLSQITQVRWGLLPVLIFVALLGLLNLLVINQKVVLYLFYIPVVFAAWMLPTRHAVSVALLGALMVIAYVFFIPRGLEYTAGKFFVWIELAIWGGILIVTAYLVSKLRIWTHEALRNLEQAYSGVLSILSKFIQTVDADTEAHSARVSAWSVRIAKELGLNAAMIEEVRIAGLLHDVGKVEVNVNLLRKAAALSNEEQQHLNGHPRHGAEIIKPVGGMLSNIADAIEAHHEKYDGSGYYGMKAEQIPIISRIIAVADAFDALLSDRPYRKGVGIFKAMDGIIAAAESHFDPKVVIALKHIVNRDGERVLETPLPTADEATFF
ncbi:MAG: HD-GYP domain-containing protein [Planctomycetota bacterium]|nr:HD-GYP domain-containing protein [Planctomycetota bacterium]